MIVPLPIVQTGDPVLRQVARPLTRAELGTPAIVDLSNAMRDTMRAAPGVGLAAPQVGESMQLVVIEDRAERPADVSEERWGEWERAPVPCHVLVNPVVISHSARQVSFFEGCLSVAGFRCVVPRAWQVEVEAWDANGDPVRIQARGWYARILQHEIDHLNGVLCVDRMDPRSLSTTDNHVRYWKEVSMAETARQLGLK